MKRRPELTKRQKEILEYIHSSIDKDGCIPSESNIGKHFGFTRVAAHWQILVLKDKGYLKGIKRVKKGRPANK